MSPVRIETQAEKHPVRPAQPIYLVEEEYLVTAFVPSETACLASSPGRIRRTLEKGLVDGFGFREKGRTYEVWISRDEMVDFLL
jgi:hypothetical protein